MEKKTKFTLDSTLSQQCYEQLQDEIINGILKPGQKLKVAPIKERFNIGQSPVREALSRLVAFGLVDVEDNKGFTVSAISESDIRDTYATFTAIENMALMLAIEHGDVAWEANIIAALHRLAQVENKKTIGSYDEWVELNYQFHLALIAGCNSPILLEIRRNLYMKFDRYCRMSYFLSKRPLSINHQEHIQLTEAVLKRDKQTVQKLMNHHINEPLEAIITNLKKNNLL